MSSGHALPSRGFADAIVWLANNAHSVSMTSLGVIAGVPGLLSSNGFVMAPWRAVRIYAPVLDCKTIKQG
tara:strand:+ start:319 stop:528 length:210 start_codon:yes stop_codon:yes gene_type:complete